MSALPLIRRSSLACRALCLALLFLMSAGLFSVRADAQSSIPKIARGMTGQALITSVVPRTFDGRTTVTHPRIATLVIAFDGAWVWGQLVQLLRLG